MEPHRFEQDGETFEAEFERTPEGWVARIRRTGDDVVHVVAFADEVGYAADDPQGSLAAGCEAAAARLPWGTPTRH
ncbi:hypothetical protein [Methylobacterium trifolii]|uniref:DUF2188 domain-containing protein n=1 Tax=Methylobacterium trifolii TaxID=1003092 RepID=A0ABQ4TVI2_9HYPH|nr:hypothetical protein [Methylobacterium trifolii]GJE58692.1 hypothetical protein MPOCJGCO_0774 [Methylobacterium trifolii]